MIDAQKSAEQIAAAGKINATTYLTTVPAEYNAARCILEQYSGIAPADVDAHIIAIRDKAWDVFPYGCIGSFGFLNLEPTVQDPLFQTVAARLRASGATETFLDVGCCLGVVVRQLIADGVSSERLYGTDLQPNFLDLGKELFRDGNPDRRGATFIAGDMLWDGDNGAALNQLNGKIDVIYAASFFHLFEWEDQLKVAKRMVGFLRSANPNTLIFGRNGGPKIVGWENYVLDSKRWHRIWDEVSKATSILWRTEIEVEDSETWIIVMFRVFRAR
ncbi:hypothetical protein B0T25DRAFT_557171 [Lasiosphaeria hispida]|uniref:Methyltransferase domain-containing protein n=1 Tax=Lasiosphaeria hispida TaxID=260671 RepID=A0AAJ0H9Z0_9PEZI|nr:hypothetical protein B0T25DRAFT_557171 [Lasiosphaeria hispida]